MAYDFSATSTAELEAILDAESPDALKARLSALAAEDSEPETETPHHASVEARPLLAASDEVVRTPAQEAEVDNRIRAWMAQADAELEPPPSLKTQIINSAIRGAIFPAGILIDVIALLYYIIALGAAATPLGIIALAATLPLGLWYYWRTRKQLKQDQATLRTELQFYHLQLAAGTALQTRPEFQAPTGTDTPALLRSATISMLPIKTAPTKTKSVLGVGLLGVTLPLIGTYFVGGIYLLEMLGILSVAAFLATPAGWATLGAATVISLGFGIYFGLKYYHAKREAIAQITAQARAMQNLTATRATCAHLKVMNTRGAITPPADTGAAVVTQLRRRRGMESGSGAAAAAIAATSVLFTGTPRRVANSSGSGRSTTSGAAGGRLAARRHSLHR